MSRWPNPILPGFHPDPSIILVGGFYYLVTSTFEYLPGIPVYRSQDLERWTLIGHVATRPLQAGLRGVPTPGGMWAPTIRHRDGVFYLIVTVMLGGRGCVVFTAHDPAGSWSDGIVLPAVDGIDPDLAWDDDGVAHVTFATMGVGIRQVQVDLRSGAALGAVRSLWSGTGMHAPEGPHLYRRGDYWYLMIAEGGTERGHAVSIARGSSPRGPFVSNPANPIITARSTALPVQNVGHADLVELAAGGTAMVLLGVRPVGFTRSFSPLGRETFLTAVEWIDGWPVVTPLELPASSPAESTTFTFTRSKDLGSQGWIAVRQLPSEVASVADGRLRIDGRGSSDRAGLNDPEPAFVGQRQRHREATVTTRVVVPTLGAGGLAVRLTEELWFSISVRRGEGAAVVVSATVSLAGLRHEWRGDVLGDIVELAVSMRLPSASPGAPETGGDRIVLSARGEGDRGGDLDGAQVVFPELDGRYWSFETAESFTGRVVGLFAEGATVDFLDFVYTGRETSEGRGVVL